MRREGPRVRRAGAWVVLRRARFVCERVHQYDSFQSGTSWPADSLPSEILSEDYKTNQRAVIAAGSL